MLNQSHNVTDPIESLMTSAIEVIRAYVQAHLVDRDETGRAPGGERSGDGAPDAETGVQRPMSVLFWRWLAIAGGGAIDPGGCLSCERIPSACGAGEAGRRAEQSGNRVRQSGRGGDEGVDLVIPNGGCMTRMTRFTLALLGLCSGLRVSAAWRAGSRGSLGGLVVDSSGGALPGVTVTIVNTGTNATAVQTTNRRGSTPPCCCSPAPTPSRSS